MYHYLTTNDGKKIVDVEPWIKDGRYEFIGGVCNIRHFLDLYETIPADRREEFKTDFDAIDKMRGWFFEKFLQSDLNRVVSDENLTKTHHAIKDWLVSVAKKYDLRYGED